MADPLTTTLILMYFITAPAKIPPGEKKEDQESKAVWTLQSTDHVETQDSRTCVLYAKKLFAAVRPVKTMTLRAYCLCPNGDGDSLCYAPPLDAAIAATQGPPAPTIQAIGPNTPLPEPPPAKKTTQ
jgi:hypothetical protein